MDGVAVLQAYIDSLADFAIVEAGEPYDHRGALIVDAALQAAVNYERVVWPRVERLLACCPDVKTTSALLELLVAIRACVHVRWKGPKKLERAQRLTHFFSERHLESVADLRAWFADDAHVRELLGVHGVGPKTAAYIPMLAGLSGVAVDVHLRRFVSEAGLTVESDESVRQLIASTADYMDLDRSVLDKSIWTYVSQRSLGSSAVVEP